MIKKTLTKTNIPDAPGVYFFLGARKEILYIGKATSLKNRVRSYFVPDLRAKRSELIENMVAEAKKVEWTVTDSVLEALILETNLIRTHKPRFNTISKDDKSFNHLIITNEPFPRVLLIRGKDLHSRYSAKDIKYHFGPYPSGSQLKEALRIVRRIFQYYDTKHPVGKEKSKMARGKVDFNRQIGLYPDVQSKKEYERTIRHIRLLFEGKKKLIVKDLEREMKRCARSEHFEEAERAKRKIFALTHIQDVALIKRDLTRYRDDRTFRVEAYDVAHLRGKQMVGVMTVVEGGERATSEYRTFNIRSLSDANDPAALREVLTRRFGHDEWPTPQLIVVDGNSVQKHAAESVLKHCGLVIPVVAVVKDERHRPTRLIGPSSVLSKHHDLIILANGEAHRFSLKGHRARRRKQNFD